ncbi:MAG: hypothetical protein U0136_16550 [Bdellovibrionota bacterium]
MKLNDANPTQHLAIIILGGLFIFLNIVESWKYSKSHPGKDSSSQTQIVTTMVDETGTVVQKPTKYQNPKLSWYEAIFCRGLQRSSNCSYKLLHPFAEEGESLGVAIPNGEPKNEKVLYYRGSINKNTAFSSNIESPEAVAPPVKIAE